MNIFQILNLQNLDLLFVGITVAAIGILGFIVFLNDRKSVTHKTFLLFSVLTIAYGSFNYINYQLTDPRLILWFLRLTIFFATWHAFSFFQLAYVFPEREKKFSKRYILFLLPLVVATSLLTLTPFVFSGINTLGVGGEASQARHEPGVAVFGAVALFLVLGGIFFFARKTIKAKGLEKQQLQIVSTGTFITFAFLIAFNLVLPAAFNNVTLVPLAPIFFLPLILFTAYAILRYGLLNIKVIATEILTFVLAVVTLLEIIFARDIKALIFRITIFSAVLGFGILLIRSVRKEVEQRERLESLTKELEVANAELKRLDQAKSEFISIASHQLRTPLTAIKGYLSLILENSYGKIAKKAQRPLAKVYESNERLIALVNDLLSLSRIESGKMKLELAQADIEKIIASIVDELKVKATQKNLELVFHKPDSPVPKTKIDEEKVRNAILNVIDNSIRYTNKGSVAVKADQVQNSVRITIRDTGEGMTQEEIGSLFQSFSRGEAGEKLSTDGAGLGLYIAKRFVEMHKGKIWAESEGKGKGSAFFIEIPIRG